ncbi:MAG: DUF3606 domain-containing protein [Betaproteobacteria bacterium]|nr:DUF3606 domain-containing protein [Betaproteobacteria bacterium]
MGGSLVHARQDVERLNLASRHEIEALCAAFGCIPTDVYVAVATVGDKLRDLRRHLEKVLGHGEMAQPVTVVAVGALPPMWPTAS